MYSTLLLVNSKDRDFGHSGNFTYNMSRSKFDCQAFRINKVTIPYSFYNIKAQSFLINNTVIFVDAGSFTIYTLITSLLSDIQGIYPDFNITFDAAINKVTLSNLNAFTLTFNNVGSSGSIAQALGFTSDTIGPSQNITSEVTCNLNLSTNLYISSQSLCVSLNSFFNKRQSNVIQMVPINVSSFGYIIWQNNLETIFPIDSRTIQNLDFQIFDDNGEIVFFNGQSVIFEIQLFSDKPFN
jgi:hypothetical protein